MVQVEFQKRYCGYFPGANPFLDDKEAIRLIDEGYCKRAKTKEGEKAPEYDEEPAGPFDELQLDARVVNSLTNAGFKDIEALEEYATSNENFLDVENVGPAGDDQIRKALNKRARK
jgi:DNA-directed RNA polymerase alpha subunit